MIKWGDNMHYDYQKTSISLYRAVFKSNFSTDVSCYLSPDADLANASEVAPILHPTFEQVATGAHKRPPDILPNKNTGEYDPDTGGTSVFDKPGALKRADFDFFIPAGTHIPPNLKVQKNDYNDRIGATHYTIMPEKPLFKQALMGELDNFVRNAIKRQWEAARGL